MTNTTVGREPVQILEIVQPVCSRTFGTDPCQATGQKCFNTRATCKFTGAYDQTKELAWRFISKRAPRPIDLYEDNGTRVATYGIPNLTAATVSGAMLNVGGVNRNSSALGKRASLSATFKDHPFDDSFADPYLSDRSYIAFDQGTFWGKWLARNRFYNGWEVTLYEGYADEQLVDMRKRTFVLDQIALAADGTVTLSAKDPLFYIDENTAQFPQPSSLELVSDINETATNIVLRSTSGLTSQSVADQLGEVLAIGGNALSQKYIRIDDEIISYDNFFVGGALTGVQRGRFGTQAATHTADTKAQRVGTFGDEDDTSPTQVKSSLALYELLTVFGNVSPSLINYDQAPLDEAWETEDDTYLGTIYELQGAVSEPQAINKLAADVLEQIGAFIWYDDEAQQIKFKTIRPEASTNIAVLDDFSNTLADSVNLSINARDRVSRVFYYTNVRDATQRNSEIGNFKDLIVRVATDEESEVEYGSQKARTIYARYITTADAGTQLSTRLLTRYRDEKKVITYSLDAKDDQYKIGDVLDIQTRMVQDEFGANPTFRYQVIGRTIDHRAGRINLTLQNFEFVGRYANWSDDNDGLTDYNSATEEQRNEFMFWCDDSGLMPNGDQPYFWW